MASTQVIQSTSIVLATLNAKYIHASLGLRYLLANMGELRPQTVLREFTIARAPRDVVDELLATFDVKEKAGSAQSVQAIPIVGFGVYVWNVLQTTAVVRLLKAARPDIRVVLGGPEVSHEHDGQDIVTLSDHVITGWGDLSFARLCRDLQQGTVPLNKIIAGERPALEQIVLPYSEYSDADLEHRLLYVEASRGCPFACEFCLSALDKTARAFEQDSFLAEMQILYQRGARNFKFVDRTFNLNIDAAVRILQFFLDRLGPDLFVHFEVIPDRLPDRLKQVIACFPPGVLQLEVGIQSFNSEVQMRISRKQDTEKTEANMRWLVGESNAHLHADLIFGLPGETLKSFALGFDRLYALKPHEIQLGILKRLHGAPIARHTIQYGMVYDSRPPYSVKQTGVIDSATMQRINRFSRYWDGVANSGRFKQSLRLLMGEHVNDAQVAPNPITYPETTFLPSPFESFLGFADRLWEKTGTTCGLAPELLVDELFDYLIERGLSVKNVQNALLNDYVSSGARGSPQVLKGLLPKRETPVARIKGLAQRQGQHRSVVNKSG